MVAESVDDHGDMLVRAALSILLNRLQKNDALVSTHKCNSGDVGQSGTIIVAGTEWSPLFRMLMDSLERLDDKRIDTHDFLSNLVAAIDAVSRGDEPRASFQFKMREN